MSRYERKVSYVDTKDLGIICPRNHKIFTTFCDPLGRISLSFIFTFGTECNSYEFTKCCHTREETMPSTKELD